MNNWLIYILTSLATYALSYTGAFLDGPFGVATYVRGRFDPNQKTWIGRGLNCPLCQSFWWSLLLTPFTPQPWLLSWLAIWGGAMALHRVLK